MPAVIMSNISKSFGEVKAVEDVSFGIEQGELFGLLGPNGAGKTTSLRVMLDIFKPDAGMVSILGGPMSEAKKDRIGYMPEERGLYQDIPLDRCLAYLGSLKGLSVGEVKKRAAAYLDRFDLTGHQGKKVKELSKGMQQKAQIIATLLHEPELLIVDEPFSGLDPVNTQMVMDLLEEEHQKGTTIILCSHQMHQVEELCDRIVLIDHGRVMLYGALEDIRKQFAGHAVNIRTKEKLPALDGVERIDEINGSLRLQLPGEMEAQSLLRRMVELGISLEQFELSMPTLDEIFIKVVQGKGAGK